MPRNTFRGAMVAFCNWAVENNRLAANPFLKVPVANAEADRRGVRRAMTAEERARLLEVARERPLLEALTVRKGGRKGERHAMVRPEARARLEAPGRERALIDKTLLLCGLRKAELTALTVANVCADEPVPFGRLNAANEKSKEGSELVLRDDLAAELREWLAERLGRLRAAAQEAGEPIPARLPNELPLFDVPDGLLRIFDRDLKMAGIPKKDDRGRTLDVHAVRTTLSTLLSRAGVVPRAAQAAMRHSDIMLTMQADTDPRLLDVRGALESLPSLPLGAGRQQDRQIVGHVFDGRETDCDPRRLALRLALTECKPGQIGASPDNGTAIADTSPRQGAADVRSCPE